MLFGTIGQGWVFVWMVAAGALIGAWYALLAALRRLLAAGTWLSLAADAAFGAGDAFFSAAVAALTRGEPLSQAVQEGTRLAAKTLRVQGSCTTEPED